MPYFFLRHNHKIMPVIIGGIIKKRHKIISNIFFSFYFILTLMLFPLKLLFICTLARSLGLSISNNSSAVQLKIIQSFLIMSMLGSLMPCS